VVEGKLQRRGADKLRDEVTAAQELLKLSEAKRCEVFCRCESLPLFALNLTAFARRLLDNDCLIDDTMLN
jgi:hypothetical protein